jgi:nucleoid-associated protein YgaU
MVPNFITPPPVTDQAAPVREDAKSQWITLPNASSRKSFDDDTPPRNEPAETLTERAQPRDPEPIDRVEPVPHVVQRGENFWTISRLYYGSGRYYMALWKANSRLVEKPEKLYVGMTIRIPPPEALDSSLIERPRVEAPAKPLRKTSRPVSRDDRDDGVGVGIEPSRRQTSERELALPVVDPLTDRGSRTSRDFEPESSSEVLYRPRRPLYRVRPRETLRGIARDTLGDSHRADEILELNRDIIKDPHSLVAGQVLELPEDARLGKRAH